MKRSDSAALMASNGVRADSGAVGMRVADYPLTRERADGWRGAQRALSAIPDDDTFVPLRANDEVTSEEVDRAIAYLEGRPEARRAIEQSGLSVRDYVLTALALERAERARALPSGAASDLPRGNLTFADDYEEDIRRARDADGFHVLDYDGDHDGGDRRLGRGEHGRKWGEGRRRGKWKDKWKEKH